MKFLQKINICTALCQDIKNLIEIELYKIDFEKVLTSITGIKHSIDEYNIHHIEIINDDGCLWYVYEDITKNTQCCSNEDIKQLTENDININSCNCYSRFILKKEFVSNKIYMTHEYINECYKDYEEGAEDARNYYFSNIDF
jgi:hypothetical protein